jgi:hypothetical protein
LKKAVSAPVGIAIYPSLTKWLSPENLIAV